MQQIMLQVEPHPTRVLRGVRVHAGQGDCVQLQVRQGVRLRHRLQEHGALQPTGLFLIGLAV